LAEAVAQEQGLGDAEFLPFRAGWPQLRDGYLKWLESHEAVAGFEQAEATREQPLGSLVLQGRLDRIDRLRSGAALVLDYKTESLEKTRARTRNPLEDTQMAFYAALLGEEAVEREVERGRGDAGPDGGFRGQLGIPQPVVTDLSSLIGIGDGAGLKARHGGESPGHGAG
jgi:RecB family exonuclease